MFMSGLTLCIFTLAILMAHPAASAQSTGGVTGPKLAAGQNIEYRIAFDPDRDQFAQRIHYQNTITNDLRLRAIFVSDFNDTDFRVRSLTLQAHYQFQRAAEGWNAGLQFQGVIPDGNGGPGLARIAWANSLDIAHGGEVRLAGYAARQIGDFALPGVFLETRAELSFPAGQGARVGVQSFNEWGSTADFGRISSQSHRLGPLFRFALANGYTIETSAQIGITQGAPDTVFRMLIGRSF